MTKVAIILEDYERFQGEICTEDQNGKQYHISEKDFERFLQRRGRLDGIMNYVEDGNHVEYTYTISMADYWERGEGVNEDLAEYITSMKSAAVPVLS